MIVASAHQRWAFIGALLLIITNAWTQNVGVVGHSLLVAEKTVFLIINELGTAKTGT